MSDEFIEMVKQTLQKAPAIILTAYMEDGECLVEAEAHDGSMGFGNGYYDSFEEFLNHLVKLGELVDGLTYQMTGKLEDLTKEEGLVFRVTNTLLAA